MNIEVSQYIPDYILKDRNLGNLADELQTKVISFALDAYAELMYIAKSIAKHDEMSKIAYDWANVDFYSKFNKMYQYLSFAGASILLKNGFKLPPYRFGITSKKNDGLAWASRYKMSYKPISLTWNSYYEIYDGAELLSTKCFMKKFHSQNNSALHELCHYIHASLVYNQAVSRPFVMTKGRRDIARMFVSGYAADSPVYRYDEFVAETLGGLLVGKKYPKKVLDILPKIENFWDNPNYYAYSNLIDNAYGIKSENKELGQYIPDYLLEGIATTNRKKVTSYNLDYYLFSKEEKESDIYKKYFDFIKTCAKSYNNDCYCRLAVDLFCKIMNRSFDFIDNARLSEIEIEFIK